MMCDAIERPEHVAKLSSFSLDAFEVTVGRFRRFVERWDYTPPPPGAGAHPRIAGSGWQSAWNARLPRDRGVFESSFKTECAKEGLAVYSAWTLKNLHDDIAMNCVNWYEAFAFCVWDGGRLPTEAEWELAAANGAENDLFPWGGERADPSRALFGCLPDSGPPCTFTDVTTVGTHASGKTRIAPGHHDLGGNVAEWTLDIMEGYQGAPVDDPASVGEEGARVIRGGSFATDETPMRAAARAVAVSSGRGTGVGFRCARTP
jgi:formylglycine-generating enzyme required for sulfatase activity